MTDSDTMVAVTLKPCPFCGGKAERFTIGEGEPDNAGGDVITCTRCQASSHVEFGRKENLVDRWNTRHQSGRTGAGEALEAINATPAMRQAGADQLFGAFNDDWGDDADAIWKAMIAAALSQSTAGEDGT